MALNIFRQAFFIPKPLLTEANCPDQTGRVHIVTGGYGGVGFELAKILYQHNATLYIAGRSSEKAAQAVETLEKQFPDSKGSVGVIIVDFSDLTTIKPAVEKFTAIQQSLHVLTLNHGVMFSAAKGPQGFDVQLVTNCLGSYLFYKLLHPTLVKTAAGQPAGAVRVTWASSSGADLLSPKPGGIQWENDAPSQTLASDKQYGQTKAGNSILAGVLARRDADKGIMHLSWNPGNLQSDLQRHMGAIGRWFLFTFLLYPARFGAYTELWSALADIPMEKTGSYVAPWGRLNYNRPDLRKGIEDTSETGTGEKFVKWLDTTTLEYA